MSEEINQNQNLENEELSTGLKVLSFCIPIAGAIIYFMEKDKSPKKAKTACYAALIGFGVAIVLQIIFTIIGVGAGLASGSY